MLIKTLLSTLCDLIALSLSPQLICEFICCPLSVRYVLFPLQVGESVLDADSLRFQFLIFGAYFIKLTNANVMFCNEIAKHDCVCKLYTYYVNCMHMNNNKHVSQDFNIKWHVNTWNPKQSYLILQFKNTVKRDHAFHQSLIKQLLNDMWTHMKF